VKDRALFFGHWFPLAPDCCRLIVEMNGVGSGPTGGAATPVHDLGLVDLEPVIVVGGEAWCRTYGTVDVEHDAAFAADEVVMVVPHPILVPCDRSGRLNAAHQVLLDKDAEGVVDGLTGDRTNAGPDVLGQFLRRGVGPGSNRVEHGEPLRGDLYPMTAELLLGAFVHGATQPEILD